MKHVSNRTLKRRSTRHVSEVTAIASELGNSAKIIVPRSWLGRRVIAFLHSTSGEVDRRLPEESSIDTEPEPVERKSSAELAQQFGISQSTVETTPASGHTTAAGAKPAHLRSKTRYHNRRKERVRSHLLLK
jgi:hypothetical protein